MIKSSRNFNKDTNCQQTAFLRTFLILVYVDYRFCHTRTYTNSNSQHDLSRKLTVTSRELSQGVKITSSSLTFQKTQPCLVTSKRESSLRPILWYDWCYSKWPAQVRGLHQRQIKGSFSKVECTVQEREVL